MKLEKINENQIRCTLTKEDLDNHQIRLSELAYGSDKAKALFRDMMQQAQIQFGFVADNIPLMIEAIPINQDNIILIVTKVEDPEELDTRFSKFAPFKGSRSTDTIQLDGADNIIDIFQKLVESKIRAAVQKSGDGRTDDASAGETKTPEESDVNLLRLFSFGNLDDVIDAAHSIAGSYTGENSLYKDDTRGGYSLVLHQSKATPEEFNKVCNILSEYGQSRAFTLSGEGYLKEHGDLISDKALQQLAQI